MSMKITALYERFSRDDEMQGEKMTSKHWKTEIQLLQAKYDSTGKEQSKTATELAYAKIISYNKKKLKKEFQNESRQQIRTKRRKEEIQ